MPYRSANDQGAPRGEPNIHLARAYEDVDPGLGHRVLVDRLWPRGLAKAVAPIDEWLKGVAPSRDLRRWYGHQPDRFEEFSRRYRAELADGPGKEEVGRLRRLAVDGGLVLVTATSDVDHSGAAVLMSVLIARDEGSGAET